MSLKLQKAVGQFAEGPETVGEEKALVCVQQPHVDSGKGRQGAKDLLAGVGLVDELHGVPQKEKPVALLRTL